MSELDCDVDCKARECWQEGPKRLSQKHHVDFYLSLGDLPDSPVWGREKHWLYRSQGANDREQQAFFYKVTRLSTAKTSILVRTHQCPASAERALPMFHSFQGMLELSA